MRPGDLLYFDELPDHDHELRALLEHRQRTALALEPLAFAEGGTRWLWRYARADAMATATT